MYSNPEYQNTNPGITGFKFFSSYTDYIKKLYYIIEI